jgi:hypothetical protein
MIESLGEDAVGRGVGVDVGIGVRVAVGVAGKDRDSFEVVQAVRTMSPKSKTHDNFFSGNIMNSVLF